MVTILSDRNVSEVMQENTLPVMIDFYANCHGPCQWISPVVDQLAEEYRGRVLVCKCNIDGSSQLAHQFGVRNVPTVLFLKDGKIADRQVGLTTKVCLMRKMNVIL